MKTLRDRTVNRIKEYFDHSSIQGLRYITEPNRTLTERTFWISVCILSTLGTYKLLLASYSNFQNNSVSFVVETSYLNWNTSFAAISLCESESPDKVFERAEHIFGKKRNMNIDPYLKDIEYFDGTCYSCSKECKGPINCTRNFGYLVKEARAPCNKFLKHCSWNGQPFDCCSQFLPLQSETGLCFTFNSLYTKAGNEPKMDFISNRHTGPGRLEFRVYETAKLYIHSPDDVPFVNHPMEQQIIINIYSVWQLKYQVFEISNDPRLKEISVEQRNCRFPNENTLDVYDLYSYSACVVDCRAKAQAALCNCTHHFMPKLKGVETCDIDGLICLTEYSETLRTLKTEDSEENGLVCDCKSSCIEYEYTVVGKTLATNDEDTDEELNKDPSKVTVHLEALPTQRFRRNVIRTPLDLVVSMGGTIGLFLGASLLSMAELIVFAFLRNKKNHETKHKKVEQPERTDDFKPGIKNGNNNIGRPDLYSSYHLYNRSSDRNDVYPFRH